MTPTAPSFPDPGQSIAVSAPAPFATDEAKLREALKRCPPKTFEAASAFRQTGDFVHLPTIVRGVIARFVERERRARLEGAVDEVHLVEDLGLDSLTMMEIVMLAEDVFPISINNDELRGLRTIGSVQRFIECKLRGEPPPAPEPCTCAGATFNQPTAVAQRPVQIESSSAPAVPS